MAKMHLTHLFGVIFSVLVLFFSYEVSKPIIMRNFILELGKINSAAFLPELKSISHNIELSDLRTQYAKLIVFDLTTMYMGVRYSCPTNMY